MRAPAPHAAHIHPTPQDGRRGSSRHRQRRDRGGGSCRRPDASSGGWGAPCPRPSAPTPLAGAAAGDRRRVGRRAVPRASPSARAPVGVWRRCRAPRGQSVAAGQSRERRAHGRRHPAVLRCAATPPSWRARARECVAAAPSRRLPTIFFCLSFLFSSPLCFCPPPGLAAHGTPATPPATSCGDPIGAIRARRCCHQPGESPPPARQAVVSWGWSAEDGCRRKMEGTGLRVHTAGGERGSPSCLWAPTPSRAYLSLN